MPAKPYTSYNKYFLVPFIIWIAAGGLALLLFDQQVLFAAFNTHYTPLTDFIMLNATYMGEGAFNIMILLLLLGRTSLRNWWFFTAALLCNVLPNIVTNIVKHSAGMPRPLKHFNEADWIHILPEWPRLMERSFPSGHTTAAFCFFCFISFLLPEKYKKLGLLFFALALLVGYSRMYLAVHFFIDVYVGSIIGTVFTTFIIMLMNRYSEYFFKKT